MKKDIQILLVEDDEHLAFLLKDSLDSLGWKVQRYVDGQKGLTGFLNTSFDLCILDVMLPDKDGYDLAEGIRRYNQQIPIIFLTARNQTEDKIRGFQVGADDYVCKPFSIEELKYRVQALIRRCSSDEPLNRRTILEAGNSSLDLHELVLNANGKETRLTYKEAKLLELFFRHCNTLIQREIFLKAVWKDDGFFVARSMDVFISRIRKYLSDDTTLKIENFRGVGYTMKHNAR